ASTPRTQNRYDEGIETLAATWWSNPDFAGAPAGYSTGINPATNLLYMSWGSGGPAELGGGTQNFSGRITGYILADNTTPYSIRATSFIGTLRIIVDGTVALDETATSSSTVSGSFTAGSAGWKPITIEYSDNSASNAGFGLWWRQNSDPYVRIPGDHTSPGYGLVTSTTDPVGVVSTTSYEDSATDLGPEDGFVTQTVTDFGTGKLNLAETTTYESSAGYRREVSAVRPLGAAATTAKFYYGGTESIDNPCTSLTDPAPQGGQLKMSRDADPAGSGGTGGIEASYIYNDQGRIAASKIGSGGWTCTTYDARGRATMVDVPASGAAVSRVTTTDWAVSNNPLVTSQSDTVDSGTTRTTTTAVDLLGRVRQYEDAWGNVTITSYDQVGRTAQILSPAGTETFSYDANGNPGPTVVDSVTLATPYYDAAGRLSWVQYANGIKSDAVTYDNYGNETSATWRRISDNAVLSTETAAYDLAGRIVELVTDGNNPNPSGPEYTYDRAGRLTSAYTTTRSSGGTISTLHTSYGFGTASGTCGGGTQSAAGKNTNRTSQTVGSTTTTYCYDAADRLVSTSQAGVGTITYDGHGNTTGIWGETRGYDASDRHLTTTKPDGTSVTYQRDATDRIVARTTTGPGGTASQTERYGFTGSSDSPGLTLDGTGTLIETTAGLIGGALRTRRIGGTDVWSLPNLHGDVVATVDNSGATLGVTATYGPYGETNTTLDNSHGNLDYGWLGQHQRPTETQTGLTTTIEMGARQYDPTLGRFLEVDPIEGGSANDYDYVAGDPNNNFDLDGDRCWTGVARRETSRVYNKKKKKWETKTKEICRSVSRGAGRVIRGGARTTRNIGVPALGLAWRILRAKPGPPIMVPCRLVCGMGTRRETA
ncbi:MAG: hypothetical protein KDA95_04945, partial [Acidimicrobiales bacterium]|nr:hypothetical protein [Acidimicrobiales bacterium]